MGTISNRNFQLPPEQQAVRDKCFHPSGTFVEFPVGDVEISVPARFEKMVARFPNNPAVVTPAQTLSYGELNRRANQVAHSIIDHRGGASEPVALFFETKSALIVAMLGVMKAGKFVVVLDPASPQSRLLDILNDAGIELLLSEEATAARAIALSTARCQVFDIGRCAKHREDDPQWPIAPDALLCVSYTTGSTGKPRGVMLSHRNLLHQVLLFTSEFHHCERDRLSYLASGANPAVHHAMFALLVGAAVLPFDVRRQGLEALAAWLKAEEISVCSLSAPLFRNLARMHAGRLDLPALRLLRLSSEASYKNDFELYREKFPFHCLLANGVSPTETNLLTTFLMDHGSAIDTDEIPIGYPVQDKEISLVDDAGHETGLDQVGEIVVRSAYISPGYWNRPELTSAKFELAGGGTAMRLYRTGDLGLRRSDGCLIHKGRKDFRVKIRGYGVEPADVEAIVRQHPVVREVCVVANPDRSSGATRLIAYFTQDPGACLDSSELRSFLRNRLPDYMIPAAFVALAELPLTDNGKVDRAALPSPAFTRPELNIPYTAPTHEREERLSRIWCDVLGLQGVGIHDNFFDLGGDSLSAMRLMTRVANAFHADIPFIDFYEAPTISALANLLESCPRAEPQSKAVALEPRKRRQPIPLALGQERLWFIEQFEPQAHRHNLVTAFALRGWLDTAALEQAINQIVKRHESLRTIFDSTDGKPFQVVLDSASIGVRVVHIAPETFEDALDRLCADEAQRPFDLSGEPLLRATVVRAGSDPVALILAMHHLVFDGWSMDIFARELSASYLAAVTRQPCQLAPLSIQYADFAMWQRDRLQDHVLDAPLSYWRNHLAEISDLQMPTDRPRPRTRDGKATRRWFTISPTVTRSLKDLSGEAGATLFMTLLAAYQTLLYRYSGQDDICVGVPVSGRQDDAFDDVIGFFLNMLVIRADLSGNPTFLELLGRVRRRCLEAYGHQDVPFERLVEELQPRRAINRHPLFQASFALRPGNACALRLTGMEVQELEVHPGNSRFDVELFLEERNQGLHGYIAGSADLFDASTIERGVAHFRTLLESIALDPKQCIGALSILTEAERRQLLVQAHGEPTDYPKDSCVHELFEEQVKRDPDAVAVVCNDRQLTYRELNNRANQLGHYLRKVGVGPEVLVGLCVDRSIEMIVGLLGILKAGGAYVPLDPHYPRVRLQFMLEDCRVAALVTQQASLGTFADGLGASQNRRIICLDRDRHEIAQESEGNLESEPSSDHLAYVIYTSGSSGQPKGIAIEHRNAAAFLSWAHSTFTREDLSGVLAASSICFDLSVFEIFAPLTCGGTVVLAENALDVPDMADVSRVILINTTPSAMTELLRLKAIPPSVRVINLAGEALSQDLVRQIYESTFVDRIYDLYGPSECTTYSTWALRARQGRQTIGRPIANAQTYILDACLNPVPVGVAGELYIGGAGLARGYLNRPELTAAKFIMHAFDEQAPRRLYRTGDWARYLPDGNIELLGRMDDQVKIRGWRVEPGEIEATLKQHPALREAVVVARQDGAGHRRLIAYVVPVAGSAPSPNELQSFVQQKLPPYMMPATFVLLEALPLTAHGKVDRNALPAPEPVRPELDDPFVAARGPVEEALATIWAEVLKLDKVGIHDDFFALGGHSLLATQVVSRIRERFHVKVPLLMLFERPTVEQLAVVIAELQAKMETELSRLLAEVESLPDKEAR